MSDDACTLCGGPWHPATGAAYSTTARACRACVMDVWTMLLTRMHGRSRNACFAFLDFADPFVRRAVTYPNFYDHVAPVTP